MRRYYHCFFCNNIPSLIIKDNIVKVKCPLANHEKEVDISQFLQNCVKKCDCINGIISVSNKNFKKCECLNKIQTHNFTFINTIQKNNQKEKLQHYNLILKNFIDEMRKNIKSVQNKLSKMNVELDLYEELMTTGKDYINNDLISNLLNLEIFKNIDYKANFFIEKINEINNFHNFEYINKNFEMPSYSKKYENKTDIPVTEIINDNLDNKNVIFNNNRSKIIINEKFLKKPEKPLYQICGIKLEDLQDRHKYITDKLTKFNEEFEDISIEDRNKFFEIIKSIGEEASKFSKELTTLLKFEFQKQNKGVVLDDNNETTKRALSSWFNQSLIINEKNFKKRPFFDYYCKEPINKIKNNIPTNKKWEKILSKNLYNFENLFSDLTQLYTEANFYSEKEITLRKIENYNFINDLMKDITDVSGKKNVKYTILPGLFSKEDIIGKINVFCEKKTNMHNSNKQTKVSSCIYPYKYICYIDYKLENDKIKISINNVYPRLNSNYFAYKLTFKNILGEKNNYTNGEFIIDKETFKNKTAICTVFVNNEILCVAEQKLEINEPNYTALIVKNGQKNVL